MADMGRRLFLIYGSSGGMAGSSQDRITAPTDLRELAREAEEDQPSSVHLRRHAVPRLTISHDELLRLPLDHRAGFILSLVDGRSSIETIADMSGMAQGEATGILADLVARGVLSLRER